MDRPATSASEKASPLLASSFVLLEAPLTFLPLSLSLAVSCSVLTIFFLFSLLLYDLGKSVLLTPFLSSTFIPFASHYVFFSPPLHHSISSCLFTAALSCLFVFLTVSLPLLFSLYSFLPFYHFLCFSLSFRHIFTSTGTWF